MIKIRRAEKQDVETIARFNELMALETEDKRLEPAIIRQGVAHLLEQPQRGFYLVAELDGRVVGCLMITYEWSDWRDAVFWWVQSVYVESSYRGRGAYRALYETTKKMAMNEGDVCGIRLYVERKNERAKEAYRKLGMADAHYLVFEEMLCSFENHGQKENRVD